MENLDSIIDTEESNVLGTLAAATALTAFGALAFYGAYKIGEKAGNAVAKHINNKYPKKV